MTFIFTLITGISDFYATFDVSFDSTDLFDAVHQLKHYLSGLSGSGLLIVSCNYVVISGDGQKHDHIMSDSFYDQYVLEDDYV